MQTPGVGADRFGRKAVNRVPEHAGEEDRPLRQSLPPQNQQQGEGQQAEEGFIQLGRVNGLRPAIPFRNQFRRDLVTVNG